ncbi:MAG TPA: hypothetical protein VE398_16970 [Acidobacteriota bacterium]|nr:hypothetical protein [Acidobacteriota bacterium]
MKRRINWLQFLNRTNTNTPGSDRGEVIAHMHYRDRSNSDVIENFRVGDGSHFLLTFLEGGMIDLNLMYVKEIKFENVVMGRGRELADTPNYQVRVSLTNGKVLEGYSGGLHSFSGLRDGSSWSYSCRGRSAEQVEARNNLSRIVVRKAPQV